MDPMEFLSRLRVLRLGTSARSMNVRWLLEMLRIWSLCKGSDIEKSKASRSLLPKAVNKDVHYEGSVGGLTHIACL